jgi:hypothetical protein
VNHFKIALAILSAGFLASCNKYKDSISLQEQENQNQGDYSLMRTDTFTILANSWAEDSIPVSNLSYYLLGAMNDPETGQSFASIATNLYPTQPGKTFPATAEMDSAVLFLPFPPGNNFYGNPGTAQAISVYQLRQPVDENKYYYNTDKVSYGTEKIGSYFGRLKSTRFDSIRYNSGKILMYPGLRIRLSDAFARTLFNAPTAVTQTKEAFSEYIKGLALVPEDRDFQPEEGGVALMDLNPSGLIGVKPRVILYYDDTSQLEYEVGYQKTAVNQFEFRPASAALTAQLNGNNWWPYTYAQSMGGCKTYLKIPWLLNLVQDHTVVINKAELFVSLSNQTSHAFYPPPARLNLGQPISALRRRSNAIRDFSDNPAYGGTYLKDLNGYKFNITLHVQDLINQYFRFGRRADQGLLLFVPSDSPVSGSRAVFDMRPGNTKLVITYTKLNN